MESQEPEEGVDSIEGWEGFMNRAEFELAWYCCLVNSVKKREFKLKDSQSCGCVSEPVWSADWEFLGSVCAELLTVYSVKIIIAKDPLASHRSRTRVAP